MNVVADAGAIRCRIVLAEDGNALALTESNLQDDGDQVTFWVVVFTDGCIRRCARSVEVAKRSDSETVRMSVIDQCAFDDELGKALGINRVLRRILFDRHLVRLAIGCRRT